MKLEIKYLAPYLPYGLKGIATDENQGIEILLSLSKSEIITDIDCIVYSDWKPIFRPLSDLTIFYDEICWILFDSRNPNNYESSKFEVDQVIKEGVAFDTYNGFVNWMYENHFDVFGLIKHDLAININTLNK